MSLHRNDEVMNNNSCPLLFLLGGGQEINNVVCMASGWLSVVMCTVWSTKYEDCVLSKL